MSDEKKPEAPWNIKGVSRETRDLAARKAKASDMFMGEWLAEAIRRYAEVDIIPPNSAALPAAIPDAIPAALPPPAVPAALPPAILQADMSGLAAALSAVHDVSRQRGTKPPVSLAAEVARTAKAYAKAVRTIGTTGSTTEPKKRATAQLTHDE